MLAATAAAVAAISIVCPRPRTVVVMARTTTHRAPHRTAPRHASRLREWSGVAWNGWRKGSGAAMRAGNQRPAIDCRLFRPLGVILDREIFKVIALISAMGVE